MYLFILFVNLLMYFLHILKHCWLQFSSYRKIVSLISLLILLHIFNNLEKICSVTHFGVIAVLILVAVMATAACWRFPAWKEVMRACQGTFSYSF